MCVCVFNVYPFRNTKKGIEKISSLEQEIIKNEQKVSEIKVLHQQLYSVNIDYI